MKIRLWKTLSFTFLFLLSLSSFGESQTVTITVNENGGGVVAKDKCSLEELSKYYTESFRNAIPDSDENAETLKGIKFVAFKGHSGPTFNSVPIKSVLQLALGNSALNTINNITAGVDSDVEELLNDCDLPKLTNANETLKICENNFRKLSIESKSLDGLIGKFVKAENYSLKLEKMELKEGKIFGKVVVYYKDKLYLQKAIYNHIKQTADFDIGEGYSTNFFNVGNGGLVKLDPLVYTDAKLPKKVKFQAKLFLYGIGTIVSEAKEFMLPNFFEINIANVKKDNDEQTYNLTVSDMSKGETVENLSLELLEHAEVEGHPKVGSLSEAATGDRKDTLVYTVKVSDITEGLVANFHYTQGNKPTKELVLGSDLYRLEVKKEEARPVAVAFMGGVKAFMPMVNQGDRRIENEGTAGDTQENPDKNLEFHSLKLFYGANEIRNAKWTASCSEGDINCLEPTLISGNGAPPYVEARLAPKGKAYKINVEVSYKNTKGESLSKSQTIDISESEEAPSLVISGPEYKEDLMAVCTASTSAEGVELLHFPAEGVSCTKAEEGNKSECKVLRPLKKAENTELITKFSLKKGDLIIENGECKIEPLAEVKLKLNESKLEKDRECLYEISEPKLNSDGIAKLGLEYSWKASKGESCKEEKGLSCKIPDIAGTDTETDFSLTLEPKFKDSNVTTEAKPDQTCKIKRKKVGALTLSTSTDTFERRDTPFEKCDLSISLEVDGSSKDLNTNALRREFGVKVKADGSKAPRCRESANVPTCSIEVDEETENVEIEWVVTYQGEEFKESCSFGGGGSGDDDGGGQFDGIFDDLEVRTMPNKPVPIQVPAKSLFITPMVR